ncbi:hypothetical protein [Euzebya tangerina]|uniref:hypothetical protein n=1 Tax=Euzebya tangerina TaxID=591198 RepID=UPI0013C3691D|nr:hypothetical protein [Euzebya tangerina]
MSDFSDALQQRLSRNQKLAAEREQAEAEMDRVREEEAQRDAALDQAKRDRHAELSAHLQVVAEQLKASKPDSFIVRTGWSASGEEYLARMKTRQMSPKRELYVEVDRDDDEVLARWTSDIGTAIEVWRLLEVTPEMITQMVLQVADDGAWSGRRPPRFPGADEPEE